MPNPLEISELLYHIISFICDDCETHDPDSRVCTARELWMGEAEPDLLCPAASLGARQMTARIVHRRAIGAAEQPSKGTPPGKLMVQVLHLPLYLITTCLPHLVAYQLRRWMPCW
jgi:hypothetical protein